jgi:integrase
MFVLTPTAFLAAPTSRPEYRKAQDRGPLGRQRPLLLHDGREVLGFRNFYTASCKAAEARRVAYPRLLQDLLGHASVAMTLDRYRHVPPGIGPDRRRDGGRPVVETVAHQAWSQ